MNTQPAQLKPGLLTSATPQKPEVRSSPTAPGGSPSPAADRVMRIDRRGRTVLDAHSLPARYATMLTQLSSNVLGQSHAFPPILGCIQRYESGLADPKRPVGVGFLGGPTGVGKTLTAEQIAICLHKEPLFIKIPCGELQEKSALASWVGAPPTYTGHGKTMPMLTQEFLDKHKSPHSDIVVLLLDEFEKAHPDFQKLLLEVEENGILRVWVPKKGDGNNDGAELNEIKMYNVLILKTSNAGVEKFAKRTENDKPKIGFGADLAAASKPAERVLPTPDEFRDELRGVFAPEFLNRQDFFVFYNWLKPEHIPQIRRREVQKVETLLNGLPNMHGASLRLTPAALKWVDARGFDAEFGARPLRRLIQTEFVTPLGNLVTDRIIKPYDAIAAQPSEDGKRLDFVPLRVSTPRAREKLAEASAEAELSKDDSTVVADRLDAAVVAVMNALPEASGLRETLNQARQRAGEGKDAGERAEVLKQSLRLALEGQRLPKAQVAGASAETPSSSRALAVIPTTKAPAAANVFADINQVRATRKTAGDDTQFVEQLIELVGLLAPYLEREESGALTKAAFAAQHKSPVAARAHLSDVLRAIAPYAATSSLNDLRVREATAGAFRAAINFDADASLLSGEPAMSVKKDREAALRALSDAVEVSGAQPAGGAESDFRSVSPFTMFRKVYEAEQVRDSAIARLDAMRAVVGDAFGKGKAVAPDVLIGPPAQSVQAVGIAFAARSIEDANLRKTVTEVITRYLDARPLRATPRQLQELEQLIRRCNGAPTEEIAALCENFQRAEMVSGSVFRGALTSPRRGTLSLPKRPAPNPAPARAGKAK